MRYSQTSNLLCTKDIKHAALYFDGVLPLSMAHFGNVDSSMKTHPHEAVISIRFDGSSDPRWGLTIPEYVPFRALTELIYGTEHENKDWGRVLGQLLRHQGDLYREITTNLPEGALLRCFRRADEIGMLPKQVYSAMEVLSAVLPLLYVDNVGLTHGKTVRDVVGAFLKQLGWSHAALLLPPSLVPASDATPDDVTITLARIHLVDVDKAPWDQITEFRKDQGAREKFRRLRLFAFREYSGKSVAFIEDDLLERLAGYDAARKAHGFDTTISSLSVLLDAKQLQTAAAGGIVSGLFGGPIAGLGTALSIEIAGIALHVAKKLHSFAKLKQDHELAYIIEARDRLGGGAVEDPKGDPT